MSSNDYILSFSKEEIVKVIQEERLKMGGLDVDRQKYLETVAQLPDGIRLTGNRPIMYGTFAMDFVQVYLKETGRAYGLYCVSLFVKGESSLYSNVSPKDLYSLLNEVCGPKGRYSMHDVRIKGASGSVLRIPLTLDYYYYFSHLENSVDKYLSFMLSYLFDIKGMESFHTHTKVPMHVLGFRVADCMTNEVLSIDEVNILVNRLSAEEGYLWCKRTPEKVQTISLDDKECIDILVKADKAMVTDGLVSGFNYFVSKCSLIEVTPCQVCVSRASMLEKDFVYSQTSLGGYVRWHVDYKNHRGYGNSKNVLRKMLSTIIMMARCSEVHTIKKSYFFDFIKTGAFHEYTKSLGVDISYMEVEKTFNYQDENHDIQHHRVRAMDLNLKDKDKDYVCLKSVSTFVIHQEIDGDGYCYDYYAEPKRVLYRVLIDIMAIPPRIVDSFVSGMVLSEQDCGQWLRILSQYFNIKRIHGGYVMDRRFNVICQWFDNMLRGGVIKVKVHDYDNEGNISFCYAANVRREQIPPGLMCPLTLRLFEDPVILSSGYTYSREAYLEYRSKAGNIDPLLQSDVLEELIDNHVVKEMIKDYIQTKLYMFKDKLDKGGESGDFFSLPDDSKDKVYANFILGIRDIS